MGSYSRMAPIVAVLHALGLLSAVSAASLVEPLVPFKNPEPAPSPKESGTSTCPEKWIDASFVDMGCLLFNSTTTMDWESANTYCQGAPNATLVEIATEMQLAFVQM